MIILQNSRIEQPNQKINRKVMIAKEENKIEINHRVHYKIPLIKLWCLIILKSIMFHNFQKKTIYKINLNLNYIFNKMEKHINMIHAELKLI